MQRSAHEYVVDATCSTKPIDCTKCGVVDELYRHGTKITRASSGTMPERHVVFNATPWEEARLECGIGHRYRGQVRSVQHKGYDMDGQGFLYPPSPDFDPKTCVVCGLMTWKRIDA